MLTELTKLQQLRLEVVGQGMLQSRDCLHLMHLRDLTSLALCHVLRAVDDMVAVTLACNLPELRFLDLTACAIITDTPMPAFVQLRHLTKIVLTANSGCNNPIVAQLQQQRRAAGLPSVIVMK